MKKHIYWIALLALSTTALPVQAQGVSREKWMEVMSTTLPNYLCGQNEYFRQCFKVSAQQCQQTALSATRTCLRRNESKIPAVLRSRDEGGNGVKWSANAQATLTKLLSLPNALIAPVATTLTIGLNSDKISNPKLNW